MPGCRTGCQYCGRRTGVVFGFTGFGIVRRRHERRCVAAQAVLTVATTAVLLGCDVPEEFAEEKGRSPAPPLDGKGKGKGSPPPPAPGDGGRGGAPAPGAKGEGRSLSPLPIGSGKGKGTPTLPLQACAPSPSKGKGGRSPPGPPPPAAKGKGKAKGCPPPAPPAGTRKKAAEKAVLLLKWSGPRPPARWESQCMVNWTPIQSSRLEGSIWQKVHAQISSKRGLALDEAELIGAFMVDREVKAAARAHSAELKATQPVRRLLAGKALMQADILHSHIHRMGFTDLSYLRWVIGSHPSESEDGGTGASSSSASSGEERKQLEATALEASAELRETWNVLKVLPYSPTEGILDVTKQRKVVEELGNFIHQIETSQDAFAEEFACRAQGTDRGELAPTEVFAMKLFEVAPLHDLSWRVNVLDKVLALPSEIALLREQLGRLVEAGQGILESTAVLKLLQGVLLLGNFVNSSSTRLGEAVAVTLDSLGRLAHTKVLMETATPHRRASAPAPKPKHALALLLRQLAEKDRCGLSFCIQLTEELDRCWAVRDCDPKVIEQCVRSLEVQLTVLKGALAEPERSSSAPAWLHHENLRWVIARDTPALQGLRDQLQEIDNLTLRLRTHFAEPSSSSYSHIIGAFASLRQAAQEQLHARIQGSTQATMRQLARTLTDDSDFASEPLPSEPAASSSGPVEEFSAEASMERNSSLTPDSLTSVAAGTEPVGTTAATAADAPRRLDSGDSRLRKAFPTAFKNFTPRRQIVRRMSDSDAMSKRRGEDT